MLLLAPLLALAAPATVTPATVPATGHAEAIVTVDPFGRYALEVTSPRGTSLQVVDHMSGPGKLDGVVGVRDGRVDVFLDRGEVKLWLESAPNGTGEAAVKATRFEELQGPDLPLLLELREETTSLSDKEQRSWWIDIPERTTVSLEAAGRYLGDLRLWQDGTWLHPSTPHCALFEPIEGQPWRDCTLETQLEPGLYRVTAYGGVSEPWTEDLDDNRLWVRMGVPELGVPSEHRITLDAKGFARFNVPNGASTARLALPENTANAQISSRSLSGEARFARGRGNVAKITDESRVPEAAASIRGRSAIEVRGIPGQTATLQILPPARWTQSLDSGRHTLTSIVGAHDADVFPPTGLIYRRRPDRATLVVESYAIKLNANQRVEERFNLLSDGQMLVSIPDTGSWNFSVEGDAYVTVEPLLLDPPPRYRSPKPSHASVTKDLSGGLHLVKLHAVEPGIVTLQITPNTWSSSARELVGAKLPLMKLRPVLQDLQISSQDGDRMQIYGPPGVLTATSVRDSPIDVSRPLALTLLGKEKVTVRVRVPERGVLTATTPDGSPLLVDVEGTGAQEVAEVSAGAAFAVKLKNPSDEVTRVSLKWRPHTHLPDTPPPTLTRERLAQLPDFPDLDARAPAFLDLERTESTTYAVDVAEPGLYHLQSTGLLATSGEIRTRTQVGFASANQNGVGRNFLVSRYLGSGDYQLSLSAQGKSRGHLGISLAKATEVAGGPLLDGEPARITLPAGDAVRYSLDVDEDSSWTIESKGLGRNFSCRIEDSDGYPIQSPPEQNCALSRQLRKGTYSVVVVPERTESRRLTRAVRAKSSEHYEGHGPHPLALNASRQHVWTEPADKDGARFTDDWTFELPADANVRIHLSETMTAYVIRDRVEIGRVLPGQPFSAKLEAGSYILQVKAARRDHGVTYSVQVATEELLAGVERSVRVPATVPVSVGGDGALILSSFGQSDVRARLEGPDGLVASNDDRPDDWNFRIEARVEPGRYSLVLEPIGSSSATTQVRMSAPEISAQPELPSGKTVTFVPGRTVHNFPITNIQGQVIIARASSTESLGVSIETTDGLTWYTAGIMTGREIELPALRVSDVRVRVWSLDPRGAEATLQVYTQKPRSMNERGLARGTRLGDARRPVGSILMSGDPGVFRLAHGESTLWQCGGPQCVPVEGGQLAAETLVLVGSGHVVGRRIVLGTNRDRVIDVPAEGDAVVDLAEHSGPLVVMASASAGTPLVRLGEHAGFAHTAVGQRASLAVDLDAKATTASLSSGDDHSIETTAGVWAFAQGRVEDLGNGKALDGSLAAGASQRLRVKGGLHTLRATLGGDVVLAMRSGRDEPVVLWAQGEPETFEVTTSASEIWLLNLAETSRSWRVRSVKTDAPMATASADGPASWSSPDAVTRLVTLDGEGTSHLLGATGRLVDASGKLKDVKGASVSGTAYATVRTEPGSGALWVSPAVAAETRGTPANPGAIELSGKEMLLRVQKFGLIELGLASPAEVTIYGKEATTTVLERGGWVRQYSPTPLSIGIRALGTAELTGTAELRVKASTPITEGIGPEVLLGPGEALAFHFDVPRDGPIGIGVKATADRVEATLVRDGINLGTGLVQMTEVTEGRHTLILALPSDAAPVRARPVLTGIEPPDLGPPDDVVRHYLELVSEAP
ncbi:MAG: hypothetical protein KC912_15230 [Proteobacteria bacterium]|nr:hypothetical protein [Pseudomonadota bacterium]